MQITEGATIHHVGIVVHDVEKTAAALAKAGIGPWGVWTVEPETTMVRGQEFPLSHRIRDCGRRNFELIAPHEGEEHLRRPPRRTVRGCTTPASRTRAVQGRARPRRI